MARKGQEDMAWMPRRLRKLAQVPSAPPLQSNQPDEADEIFAATETVTRTAAPQSVPAHQQAEFAVLPWEPRAQGDDH
jgi:hypothetical protein